MKNNNWTTKTAGKLIYKSEHYLILETHYRNSHTVCTNQTLTSKHKKCMQRSFKVLHSVCKTNSCKSSPSYKVYVILQSHSSKQNWNYLFCISQQSILARSQNLLSHCTDFWLYIPISIIIVILFYFYFCELLGEAHILNTLNL